MASEEIKGFSVTPQRLAFLLSIIAVLTFGYKVVDYVNASEYRDKAQDAYIEDDKAQTKELVTEMKSLNEKVSELVVIVKGANGLSDTRMTFAPKSQ